MSVDLLNRSGQSGPLLSTVGPAGPPGPVGPAGPAGPTGPAGSSTAVGSYSFEDDFDYYGATPASSVNTTGFNVTTGRGSWFVHAQSLSGSLQTGVSSDEHPGVLTLRTAAPGGSGAGMLIKRGTAASAVGNYIKANKIQECTWIVSTNVNTLFRLQLGVSDSLASTVPLSAIWWLVDPSILGNGNIWMICRAGGVETPFDTGVPYNAGQFYRLTHKQAVTGTITGEVDGVQVASIPSNVPIVLVDFGAVITSRIGGVVTDLNIDYSSFQSKALAR